MNINLNLIAKGFNLFGLEIKFYGITMALAMLVGVIIACKNAKERGLKPDDIYVIALFVLPFAVIGARLMFVLGSETEYTFAEALKIWEGGVSIYGGILGGALGILLYCLIFKKNFINVADIAVISLILGQAIGRWGNFFNQEVYGEVVTNSAFQWFPFAVHLDNGEWHYALFFYEFLANIAIFVVLQLLIKRTNKKGLVASIYLISYGIVRLIMEPLRMEQYNLMIFGLKLSSIISVISILAGIALLVFVYNKHKRGNNEKK